MRTYVCTYTYSVQQSDDRWRTRPDQQQRETRSNALLTEGRVPPLGVFGGTGSGLPRRMVGGKDTDLSLARAPQPRWLPAAAGGAASRQECDTVGKETGSL